MILTRHSCPDGPRLALDGRYLPADFTLGAVMQVPAGDLAGYLAALATAGDANGPLLPTLRYSASLNVYRQEIDAAGLDTRQDGRAEQHVLSGKALCAQCVTHRLGACIRGKPEGLDQRGYGGHRQQAEHHPQYRRHPER